MPYILYILLTHTILNKIIITSFSKYSNIDFNSIKSNENPEFQTIISKHNYKTLHSHLQLELLMVTDVQSRNEKP